ADGSTDVLPPEAFVADRAAAIVGAARCRKHRGTIEPGDQSAVGLRSRMLGAVRARNARALWAIATCKFEIGICGSDGAITFTPDVPSVELTKLVFDRLANHKGEPGPVFIDALSKEDLVVEWNSDRFLRLEVR